MKLSLVRSEPLGNSIIGKLTVSSETAATAPWECYTLEGLLTAIPTGSYEIEITHSPHFGRELPLLNGVHGRTNIRIHPGNVPADTEGCILVGTQHLDGSLLNSRQACDHLTGLIKAALDSGERVLINIQ